MWTIYVEKPTKNSILIFSCCKKKLLWMLEKKSFSFLLWRLIKWDLLNHLWMERFGFHKRMCLTDSFSACWLFTWFQRRDLDYFLEVRHLQRSQIMTNGFTRVINPLGHTLSTVFPLPLMHQLNMTQEQSIVQWKNCLFSPDTPKTEGCLI